MLVIVSGGQTGVDRAALDTAMRWGLPSKGWCPAGRTAEDGVLDSRYALTPTPEPGPAQRTRWNVRDSEGLIVLDSGAGSPGTSLAIETARTLGRPYCILKEPVDVGIMVHWIQSHDLASVNVAGPRESESPGVYRWASGVLGEFMQHYLAAASKAD